MLSIFAAACLAAGPININDTFDAAKHPQRKAVRGDFTFSDGVLKVTHDDALYKKHKDHGPIVIYDAKFRDAEAKLRFKLTAASNTSKPVRGAFTFDGEKGHVLRVFTYTNQPGRAVVWNEGEKKAFPVTKELPTVKIGEWTDLVVSVNGNSASITLGGKTVDVEHPALSRPKKNAKYGTAFATMELDEFSLEAE